MGLLSEMLSLAKKVLYSEDIMYCPHGRPVAFEIKKRELEKQFEGQGRVLIRTSGTEPLVRVMIEGKDKDYIARQAVRMAQLVEERLK